jgi:hypothetical protein
LNSPLTNCWCEFRFVWKVQRYSREDGLGCVRLWLLVRVILYQIRIREAFSTWTCIGSLAHNDTSLFPHFLRMLLEPLP